MSRLEAAQQAVESSAVLALLAAFDPLIVSTIWVGLDTGSSDIDIVCHSSCRREFLAAWDRLPERYTDLKIECQGHATLVTFSHAGFLFEIYASPTPVPQQEGAIHFDAMRRLVNVASPAFREAVISLKKAGLKTEPAIARALGLQGDPYKAVADSVNWSDAKRLAVLGEHNYV